MKARSTASPTGPLQSGTAADVLAGLVADELAARLGVPAAEARELARTILEPPSVSLPAQRETLERFRELRGGTASGLDAGGAKSIVRELKAVGGDLRAVRQALTGRGSGPALWAVIAALPRDETLRRIDAAL